MSEERYAEAMAKQFGKGSTRISNTERTLGGRKYKVYSPENHVVRVWRSVDGSPELRALNRQDTINVAQAITSAILSARPDADPKATMSRALIACETASSTVKLAQELPSALVDGLYENLKSVLISIFAEAA